MVAIDSKSNSTSNLVGIKENITVDEVDMLFAELFALVHTENIEEKVDNNENIINITQPEQDKISLSASNFQNNDKKTEDLAKSLVQIFYKDLGIENKNEHNNTNFSKNKNIAIEVISLSYWILSTCFLSSGSLKSIISLFKFIFLS